MQMKRKGTGGDPVYEEKEGVGYLQFRELSRESWLLHAFSTRIGGVSTGSHASMDLSTHAEEETVRENYRRFCSALGMDWKKAVLSDQTHTTNVRVVTQEDAGKGLVRPKDYRDIDGLVTAVPNLPLFTFYADCVPLYLADTKNHVIGLSHSGWRGTVNRMGEHTLKVMKEYFGTDPADVKAAVGPSICGECFEVGPEVVSEFSRVFSREVMERICREGRGDRSFIDLWEANRCVLEEAGVRREMISVTDLCTKCNPGLLFSHRVSGRERGSLAAVMMIR